MGVLLKDILAVLPNGDDVEVKETSIYISDDRIAGIGSEPAGFKCDEVIEGKGKLVIPGLINCHTHSYMAVDEAGYNKFALAFNNLIAFKACRLASDARNPVI